MGNYWRITNFSVFLQSRYEQLLNYNMNKINKTWIVAVALMCCTVLEAKQITQVSKSPKKATKAIVDGISYALNAKSNKAKVLAAKDLYTGDITIPNKFTEDSVTYYVEEIDGGAFRDCASLTSISIPTTVAKIGAGAFENCSGLTSIRIPDSIVELPFNLFSGCSALTDIELPSSINDIGHGAFKKCTALERIQLPNSVTSLPYHAFLGCTSLKDVILPKFLEKIG